MVGPSRLAPKKKPTGHETRTAKKAAATARGSDVNEYYFLSTQAVSKVWKTSGGSDFPYTPKMLSPASAKLIHGYSTGISSLTVSSRKDY